MTPNQMVAIHLYTYLHDNQISTNSFQSLIDQLETDQDVQDRKNMNGHVTSSMMLLDPTLTQALMIYHKGFDCWLFPGGHYEGSVSPLRSAIRELEEETGFPSKLVSLDQFPLIPIDIDSHMVPSRPSKGEGDHLHHDFLYLGVAKEMAPLSPQLEEVASAEWKDLQELKIDASKFTRVEKAVKLALDLIKSK